VVKAECLLSVQSTDLRGDAGQRARRAVSGLLVSLIEPPRSIPVSSRSYPPWKPACRSPIGRDVLGFLKNAFGLSMLRWLRPRPMRSLKNDWSE
jgi:hypothetical protein